MQEYALGLGLLLQRHQGLYHLSLQDILQHSAEFKRDWLIATKVARDAATYECKNEMGTM